MGTQPSEHSNAPSASRARLIWLPALFGGIAIFGAGWFLLGLSGDTAHHTLLEFGGNNERLGTRITELFGPDGTFSAREARLAQLHSLLFNACWGAIGYFLLATSWRRCWDAGPAAKPGVVKAVPFVPVAAAGLGLIEDVVTVLAIRSTGTSVRYANDVWGAAILTLTWTKWMVAGFAALLVFAMLVAATTAASQRGSPKIDRANLATASGRVRRAQQSNGDADTTEQPLDGIGICCSGGGIRAASFALGALSALERHPDPDGDLSESVLGSAKYLASVSGGGYAAAAWRIAAGTGALPKKPFLGDPTKFTARGRRFQHGAGAAPNLIEHIRERRSFLALDRGGLPLAILRFGLQTAWHLSLIFTTVYALSWPFGWVLRSWGVAGLQATDDGLVYDDYGSHQWIPPLVLIVCAVALWIIRLGFLPGPRRDPLDAAIIAFSALAIGAAVVMLALPFMVVLIRRIELHRLALAGTFATAFTAIWHLTKGYLERVGKYLGGVVLAIGLLLFALHVVEHAALQTGVLSPPWLWVTVVAGLLVAIVWTNPDSWSLHGFYRRRLTASFAARLEEHSGNATDAPRRPMPLADAKAPPLSAYENAEGPQPIICCAAARDSRSDTGVSALSMTFEPSHVTLYDWRPARQGQSEDRIAHWITHDEYTARIPERNRKKDLASVMGAAAISGAAVAPSMGRKSLKTTNALLAAFNARLGVWVPNPAYPPDDRDDIDTFRMRSPRLVNMFKEIFGIYDHDNDPNVYVTDGGHWENLGLVELIRRRCATIISIDASGDAPGTYTALKEAIALAGNECEATVSLCTDQWDLLVPDEAGLVPANFARGTITYRDGATATLLYVKAAVSQVTPVEIQRHAAGDRTFPNYSTANQLLTDLQMTWLVRLGYDATVRALAAYPDIATGAGATALAARPTNGV